MSGEQTDSQFRCPCCGREFKNILDYPRVRILDFVRLPIPEAVDNMSSAAAEKRLARSRAEPFNPDAPLSFRQDGINMTPVISQACETRVVQDYFNHLATLQGREVAPQELLPPFPSDGIFKRAYPVANTGIYLCLSDAETQTDSARVAEIEVFCDGPNMGSAGGPTLQSLGALARLHYEGLLTS